MSVPLFSSTAFSVGQNYSNPFVLPTTTTLQNAPWFSNPAGQTVTYTQQYLVIIIKILYLLPNYTNWINSTLTVEEYQALLQVSYTALYNLAQVQNDKYYSNPKWSSNNNGTFGYAASSQLNNDIAALNNIFSNTSVSEAGPSLFRILYILLVSYLIELSGPVLADPINGNPPPTYTPADSSGISSTLYGSGAYDSIHNYWNQINRFTYQFLNSNLDLSTLGTAVNAKIATYSAPVQAVLTPLFSGLGSETTSVPVFSAVQKALDVLVVSTNDNFPSVLDSIVPILQQLRTGTLSYITRIPPQLYQQTSFNTITPTYFYTTWLISLSLLLQNISLSIFQGAYKSPSPPFGTIAENWQKIYSSLNAAITSVLSVIVNNNNSQNSSPSGYYPQQVAYEVATFAIPSPRESSFDIERIQGSLSNTFLNVVSIINGLIYITTTLISLGDPAVTSSIPALVNYVNALSATTPTSILPLIEDSINELSSIQPLTTPIGDYPTTGIPDYRWKAYTGPIVGSNTINVPPEFSYNF